ncbi:MAG: hypothetical protein ACE5FW_01835 [Candidatus Aenigmatarchaeota archaeon]
MERNNRLTFEEEKWLMANFSDFGFWSQYRDFDSDIYELLISLNTVPQMYSYNWSCSKTPDNHRGTFIRFHGNEKKGIEHTWHYLGRRENKHVPPHSGYIHFRADRKTPACRELLGELEGIENVSLVETQMRIPTKEPHESWPDPIEHAKVQVSLMGVLDDLPKVDSLYLVTTVPPEVWQERDMYAYQAFLEGRYRETDRVLARHLERYSPEERDMFLQAPEPSH